MPSPATLTVTVLFFGAGHFDLARFEFQVSTWLSASTQDAETDRWHQNLRGRSSE